MASRLREQAGSLELIADWLAAIPDASQDYACVPVPLPACPAQPMAHMRSCFDLAACAVDSRRLTSSVLTDFREVGVTCESGKPSFNDRAIVALLPRA